MFINVRTREAEQPLPDEALLWQFDPSWSAAGDRLAFAGNRHPLPVILDRDLHNAWKDKQTIYIVNRDGTSLRQLVDEADRDAWSPELWSPELSPDGSEVLYTQGPQIFKVDVNSGIRTLLTNFGLNFGGDWFDPAYALPVSPQPELLTTTWGRTEKGIVSLGSVGTGLAERFKHFVCATVGLKNDERRNRYENGIDFLYDYLAADVCAGMSGFSRSPDDTENPVYLQARWQLRSLHDESGWL